MALLLGFLVLPFSFPVFSLNSPMPGEDNGEYLEMLQDQEENQEIQLGNFEEFSFKKNLLYKALEELPAREKDIIMRRFLKENPDTLDRIGKDYNITSERTRQLEARAFKTIQKKLKNLWHNENLTAQEN